jgi:hypothetical protein
MLECLLMGLRGRRAGHKNSLQSLRALFAVLADNKIQEPQITQRLAQRAQSKLIMPPSAGQD